MSPTIDTAERDLERFSQNTTAGSSAVEVLGPAERRLRWDFMGRSGSINTTVLSSGITLTAATVSWDRPWSVSVEQGLSPLKLVLLRGPGPRLTTSDGAYHALHGGTLHVARINEPVRMTFDFDEPAGAQHEELSIEIQPGRLAELLGTSAFPASIERVLESTRAYPSFALPMGPALFRTFDELMGCDARGTTRRLHLEAMGLELVATVIDRIEEAARADSPQLSAYDRDRLEAARRILLVRLADPPSLRELARTAGLNELKLKAGFRTLFGRPVFGYLREQRMQEALRLLRERRYTTSEVALRVGYANPSKFAAAFRKHYGVRPSDAG